MKALIVDDEPTVRLLLTRILRRDVDCAVVEATNGIEALDLLSRQHFDFAVLDVVMPIMDGVETLEAIRTTPELEHLPVMMLSAVRDESQVKRLVALGISAYLTKPLRPADAAERIGRFVRTLGTRPVSSAGGPRSVAGLPENSQVLVVDGDPDFRHFVKSTEGHRYVITEAAGGAQGLRMVMQQPPALVLLGQDLGPVSRDVFLHKLRLLPGGADVPVIVAASEAGPPPAEADGVIHRTFIPEVFQRQLAHLVRGGSPEQRLLAERPQVRPQMISATEQVFGMMLGVEVLAETGDAPAPATDDDIATLPLEVRGTEAVLEVGLTTTRAGGERMTGLFLQGAVDVVSDEDVAGTLQELTNIISGRLQNALRGRGDDVTIGLPVCAAVNGPVNLTEACVAVSFRDAPGTLRFTVFARAMPSATQAAVA